MAGGTDKVEACVNTKIDSINSAWLLFLEHVRLVLVIQEFDDWLPGVAIIDIVAKAGSINDGQAD